MFQAPSGVFFSGDSQCKVVRKIKLNVNKLMNVTVFHYQGSPIQFEEVDGKIMANATLMCAAFNKKPAEWHRLETTKRYIEAVVRNSHIGEEQLIVTKKGGNEATQGTWINEKLILNLARWLNIDFEIWCDERIAELLRTGKVELKPLTPAEIILHQAQQLVEHERRLDEIDTRVKKIEAQQIVVNHTIMGYANIKRVRIDVETAKVLGRKATARCKEKGLGFSDIPDEKWGKVRSYPKEALEQVFNEFLNIDKNY